MIEKFTEEELAQIKKELKERDSKSQKEYLTDREVRRLEKLFPRQEYSPKGLYPASELKLALFMICDYCTNNFTVKNKPTARHNGAHVVRATCVPDTLAEKYRNLYSSIVDVIEEWNTPFSDFKLDESGKA